MISKLTISGSDLIASEIQEHLRSKFPDVSVTVPFGSHDPSSPRDSNWSFQDNISDGGTSKDSCNSELIDTKNILIAREQEYVRLESDFERAVDTIEELQKKQYELYVQFELLRKKYDKQKSKMSSALWTECTPFHPELRHIPPMEQSEHFPETDTQVGFYIVSSPIGEGQFASVKSCHRIDEEGEFALKIINKERVNSLTAMVRISNEIKVLKKLKGRFIAGFRDVIQTKTKLYIVMERGGPDLFSFFDCFPEGVVEKIAKKIAYKLMISVLYCHQRLYCHRDLKPEV